MTPQTITQLQELLGPAFNTVWEVAAIQARYNAWWNAAAIVACLAYFGLLAFAWSHLNDDETSDAWPVISTIGSLIGLVVAFILLWAASDLVNYWVNPTYMTIKAAMSLLGG